MRTFVSHAVRTRQGLTSPVGAPSLRHDAESEPLHVVLASDEGFVLQLEVAALSLVRSCPDCRVALHILDCGIADETWTRLCARLTARAERSRTQLSVLRHVIDLAAFGSFRTWSGSRAAYARLMIPELLPDVRLCVYSDCDMLFFANPKDMIEQLVASGKMIAGHRNPCGADGSFPDFPWFDKVGEPYDAATYFCSGLVAMDLDQFRSLAMMDRVKAFLARHPDSVSADQSALNSCCRAHAALLRGNWGLFPLECYGADGAIKAIHYSGGSPWKRATWYEVALYRRVDGLWHDFCQRETGVDIARRTRNSRAILLGRLAELVTRALLALGIVPASRRQYMETMRKVLFAHSTLDRLRGR